MVPVQPPFCSLNIPGLGSPQKCLPLPYSSLGSNANFSVRSSLTTGFKISYHHHYLQLSFKPALFFSIAFSSSNILQRGSVASWLREQTLVLLNKRKRLSGFASQFGPIQDIRLDSCALISLWSRMVSISLELYFTCSKWCFLPLLLLHFTYQFCLSSFLPQWNMYAMRAEFFHFTYCYIHSF